MKRVRGVGFVGRETREMGWGRILLCHDGVREGGHGERPRMRVRDGIHYTMKSSRVRPRDIFSGLKDTSSL